MNMTRKELLQTFLREKKQRVFECSADYEHKTAKKGFEQQHEEATIAVDMLEEMIAEEEAREEAKDIAG
ncbi:hypothetical protein [Anaerotignum sp.]